MKRLFLLAEFTVLFVILAATLGFPEEEFLTISTYYPAPYGVYRDFTTYSNTTLADKNGTVSIGVNQPSSSTLKLKVNGPIRICDTSNRCGILQVQCNNTDNTCYAVYAD